MKKFRIPKKSIAFAVSACIVSSLLFTSCENDDSDDENPTETTEFSYLQIASGQTTLYDNDGAVVSSLSVGDDFYGQDANYLKGKSMSYTDHGNETVTDNNTGLMWQQIPTTDEFTWQEAVDYCNELELGGYDDWRMPSLKELFSISDFSSGWPYIDTDYFKLASGEVSKDEQFWSSNYYVGSTVEGGSKSAFGVNHVTGHIKAYAAEMPEGEVGGSDDGAPGDGEAPEDGTPPPGDGNAAPTGNPLAKYVRAVRGDEYGINKYTKNDDGTITDSASGLMWAQADNGEAMNWETALAYCEASELAGHNDWRMPNVKELQGIVDYSYSPSAENSENVGAAIDPIFSCTPIINEAGNDDYGYYWTGTSANFTSGKPFYYAWYVAFGMAVNGEGEDFHGAGGVRFDTKYEGGPLGEGGERYYNYVRMVRDAN
ncbi:MAG: DUF1566 domain-containing protein [Labilibaculum sp.]|nr:DUF1566 domain-containing protein [Labilibaculum sp.]MBI9059755.1 DUF1566 domain-containing protein [Labilibaculum sp.]